MYFAQATVMEVLSDFCHVLVISVLLYCTLTFKCFDGNHKLEKELELLDI